jgi:hypothetical protein
MEKYVKILKQVISKMDERYFKRGERDFAYELYHQIRILTSADTSPEIRKKNSFKENKIETGPEITKNSVTEQVKDNKILQKYFFKGKSIANRFLIPDLVIHEYSNNENQHLCVEIKKKAIKADIIRDLSKLAIYCKGYLNYKKGVLLLLSGNSDRIKNYVEIKEILNEFPELEIWIVRPKELPVIICNTNI